MNTCNLQGPSIASNRDNGSIIAVFNTMYTLTLCPRAAAGSSSRPGIHLEGSTDPWPQTHPRSYADKCKSVRTAGLRRRRGAVRLSSCGNDAWNRPIRSERSQHGKPGLNKRQYSVSEFRQACSAQRRINAGNCLKPQSATLWNKKFRDQQRSRAGLGSEPPGHLLPLPGYSIFAGHPDKPAVRH